MSKHTPGPWSFNTSPNCWSVLQVGSSGRWIVAGGTAWAIPGRQSEAEANARLIAAAPDLLEALEDLREWALDHGEVVFAGGGMHAVDPMNSCLRRASAAIAKATGEPL